MTAGGGSGKGGSLGGGGWALGVVCMVVIGIAAISNSGSSSESSSTTPEAPKINTEAAATPVEPEPPQPLSLVSVRSGSKHFGMAKIAGGAAGLMVYSQNCFEALGRQFSWSKLDQCGAFDQRASDNFTDESGTEANYFESETTSGRYLAAALKAGEAPSAADQRLADLQTRVAKIAAFQRRPELVPAEVTSAPANSIEAETPSSVDAAADDEEDQPGTDTN